MTPRWSGATSRSRRAGGCEHGVATGPKGLPRRRAEQEIRARGIRADGFAASSSVRVDHPRPRGRRGARCRAPRRGRSRRRHYRGSRWSSWTPAPATAPPGSLPPAMCIARSCSARTSRTRGPASSSTSGGVSAGAALAGLLSPMTGLRLPLAEPCSCLNELDAAASFSRDPVSTGIPMPWLVPGTHAECRPSSGEPRAGGVQQRACERFPGGRGSKRSSRISPGTFSRRSTAGTRKDSSPIRRAWTARATGFGHSPETRRARKLRRPRSHEWSWTRTVRCGPPTTTARTG